MKRMNRWIQHSFGNAANKTLMLVCGLLITACSGGGAGSASPTSGGGGSGSPSTGETYAPTTYIGLQGGFTGVGVSAFMDRLLHLFIRPAYAIDSNLISKVVVISMSGRYATSAVASGRFTVQSPADEPVFVLFAGSSNNYLGHLQLPNGLASVPLVNLKGGVSNIDLGNLLLSGDVVTASANPTGQTDVDTVSANYHAALGRFFSAMAKNYDADANGVIDVLEQKKFRIQPVFYIAAQRINETGQLLGSFPSYPLSGYKMAFDYSVAGAGSSESSITVNGGDFNQERTTAKNHYATHSTFFSAQKFPSMATGVFDVVFPAAEYTFKVGATTLKFNLPTQNNLKDHVLVPIPLLEIDAAGLIKKITIQNFKNSKGEVVSNPKSIVANNLQVQIERSSAACGVSGPDARLFTSGDLMNSAYTVAISDSAVNMKNISFIFITYTDYYGNHFVSNYSVDHGCVI